ncbi:MAG: DUF1839 family protein [Beijerinckiaceae bacterium]
MKHVTKIDVSAWRPHALHDSERIWPQTNCYTDLWIEILASRGLDPRAMLGFTLLQDFEGDHFTFFKPFLEDIETLYGIRTGELALFDELDRHLATQVARGRMPLVEVDSFYLPDTAGVAWHTTHQKTTIGINAIDLAAKRMVYFHNSGLYELEGADFDGALQALPEQRILNPLLPYAEFVKFPAEVRAPSIKDALFILHRNLERLPGANPFAAYAASLDAHMHDLAGRPGEYFHIYAFNVLRQAGANFELLASHLAWIDEQCGIGFSAAQESAMHIANCTKSMQFQLARAMMRGKFDAMHSALLPAIGEWDRLMNDLTRAAGRTPAAA